MSGFEIVLLAVGLAMDAFAVSVAKAPCIGPKEQYKKVVLPFLFGLFQMGMPIIGWLVGAQLADIISEYDHWIIFALLGYLGINMIREAYHKDAADDICLFMGWKEMLMLALATSIDALAIGITLAFLSVNVLWASGIIGIITFGISLVGIYLGHQLAKLLRGRAEIIGGIVLVLIGTKILLQHLGII
ncbi:manganese efflux pump MntP [Veillonella magna]|uniref:manganese efflux pump MntP n=1 Tax=Veillonella magna TaxID=464322 RepID=UPI00266559A9|nr:manganese efflux pump MntP family protein [Veillonella magna]